MSNHPHHAVVWTGTEEEYDDEGRKLFCDGATVADIEYALSEFPDVSELYFAHDFDVGVVTEFENSLEITLEVPRLVDVPTALRGRVNVVLRLPTWVDKAKQIDDSNISVIDLDDNQSIKSWHGQKVYPDDTILVVDEVSVDNE